MLDRTATVVASLASGADITTINVWDVAVGFCIATIQIYITPIELRITPIELRITPI